MKPPGKTTLARMAYHAQLEAERIEIVQDHWIGEGALKAPDPFQIDRRDAFAGIVRLIDMIQSDKVILDQLEFRKKFAAKHNAEKASAGGASDVEVDAE